MQEYAGGYHAGGGYGVEKDEVIFPQGIFPGDFCAPAVRPDEPIYPESCLILPGCVEDPGNRRSVRMDTPGRRHR
jgi:hypothetical protein